MRAFAVSCVAASFVVAFAACPPPPPEPEPCPFGAVGPTCEFVWQEECDGAGPDGCVVGAPLRCSGPSDPPVYDCVACGCGGADACVNEGSDGVDLFVCESADLREAERDDADIDAGLDEDDYVSRLRTIVSDPTALTVAEMVERLRARREEDPRRVNVVIGADDAAEVSAVAGDLFDGSFGGVASDGGCDDLADEVLGSADGGRVVVADVDAVSDATCGEPGLFQRCQPPSLSLCAEAKGVNAEALIVIGEERQRQIERALLRNATRANRDQWRAQIGGAIARFNEVSFRPPAPRFIVDGLDREVRFSVDAADDRVVWVLIDVPGGALQLSTFGLMVDDATIDDFLSTYDITPSQCAFVVEVPGGEAVPSVAVDCQKNGASITGVVFPTENDVSGLVLEEP